MLKKVLSSAGIHFNSHPHKEDDGEIFYTFFIQNISTHILTRRMTHAIRGRYSDIGNFNSHPHKEDDSMTYKKVTSIFISTHILTRRMTSRSY